MRSELTEFSYGYAIIEELASQYALQAAPILPNLIQEGHLGYDVKLNLNGSLAFLQFKLAECLVRNTAEYSNVLGLPYYRFTFYSRRRSPQHELLLNLELSGQDVFYVAPAFHRIAQLNNFYLNREVIPNSIFLQPTTIGLLPDDDDHYFLFNQLRHPVFCSEPRGIPKEAISSQKFIESISRPSSEKRSHASNSEEMETLLTKIKNSILDSKNTRFWKNAGQTFLNSNQHPIFQIAYLARTFLGLETILIKT
ncbi:MAG: hypothetical protein KJZ53_05705 [Anaerolineales bacterium]|nr:hypothetical protein [Anaerolineales bacterium]